MVSSAWRIINSFPIPMFRALGGIAILLFSNSLAWAVAAPPGPGCTTTNNAGTLNHTCPANGTCSRAANFLAGETVNFSVAVPDGPFTLSTGATNLTVGATASFTVSYVIPASGNYLFSYDNSASPSATTITATCTPADSGDTTDINKHQASNHLSAVIGLYGEHRSPLLYHNRSRDDVFQDGSGVIPEVSVSENSFTLNGSLRSLRTYASDNATPDTLEPQRWDLWLRGRYSDFSNSVSSTDGYAAVVNMGVDYELSEKWLVGLMAGYDWGNQTSTTLGTDTDITGFVVGPYASYRLSDELSLYSRAAWGRADYTFRQGGVTGITDADRMMLFASLKGTYWNMYPLRLTPDISLQYVRETLDSYTDSANSLVNGTTVELGQMRFGGEIGKRMTLSNGYLFDPFVSLHAVWNFAQEDNLDIATGLIANMADMRAQAGIGFNLQTAANSHLNFALHYDGLGSSDFSALSGTVRLVIPLD